MRDKCALNFVWRSQRRKTVLEGMSLVVAMTEGGN